MRTRHVGAGAGWRTSIKLISLLATLPVLANWLELSKADTVIFLFVENLENHVGGPWSFVKFSI